MISSIFSAALTPWLSSGDKENILSTDSDEWSYVNYRRIGEDGLPAVNDKGTIRTFNRLINERTGGIYSADSAGLVASKCARIALFAPLYTLCTMAVDFVKIFVDIGRFFKDLFSGDSLVDAGWKMVTRIGGDVAGIFRAPWYGLGVWIASIEGTFFDPLKAKQEIAIIERNWHQVDYKHDLLRLGCYRGEEDNVIFLAHCFQSEGNLNEKRSSGHDKYLVQKKLKDLTSCLTEEFSCGLPMCGPRQVGSLQPATPV